MNPQVMVCFDCRSCLLVYEMQITMKICEAHSTAVHPCVKRIAMVNAEELLLSASYESSIGKAYHTRCTEIGPYAPSDLVIWYRFAIALHPAF